MIKGLDKFKERFAGFEDQYVLIGGTATYLALIEAGLEARATQDLDIILCLEALTPEFFKAFWEFAKEGGYENLQVSTGERNFYRFSKPQDQSYPAQLELFSRAPDGMTPPADARFVRIPDEDEIYSLSAILLDTDYYSFLHQHKSSLENVSILKPHALIPLKAKAWIDLTEKKASGKRVDSRDINKHKNDLLRLYQLLTPDDRISTPDSIKADMRHFLVEIEQDTTVDLKNLKIRGTTVAKIVELIKQVYQLTE